MVLPFRSSALLLSGALLLCLMPAPASPPVAEHRAVVVAHQLPTWAPRCVNVNGLLIGWCR